MKPLHIVVLVAAGAIGGAVIMKVAFQPKIAAPVAVVAQVQTPPATAPATPPAEPADARAAGVPANPSPFETPAAVRETPNPVRETRAAVREAPKPGRAHRAEGHQAPAEVAPPSQPMTPAEPMPVAPAAPASPTPAAPPSAAPAPRGGARGPGGGAPAQPADDAGRAHACCASRAGVPNSGCSPICRARACTAASCTREPGAGERDSAARPRSARAAQGYAERRDPDSGAPCRRAHIGAQPDRKSTRLNSSHLVISYAV